MKNIFKVRIPAPYVAGLRREAERLGITFEEMVTRGAIYWYEHCVTARAVAVADEALRREATHGKSA